MEPPGAETPPVATGLSRARVNRSLRDRENWEQLVKFCLVGASGYAVNLAIYAVLVKALDVHYVPAAIVSFLVAASSNYLWNRLWTFRGQRGDVFVQGFRFLVVSLVALGTNVVVLHLLVEAGLGKIPAQAVAIVVVTPVNFVGNKLWSFRK